MKAGGGPIRDRPGSRPPTGICLQGRDTDLLLGVDGEKRGLPKAMEVSTEGSKTPVSPADNNRCLQLGIPTGAFSHTLTMEILVVPVGWGSRHDIIGNLGTASSNIVQNTHEEFKILGKEFP